MIRRPPRSTRTDTLFPYTTLFRSIVRRAGTAVSGSCFRPETTMTPVQNRMQFDRVWSLFDDAIARGARVAVGGERRSEEHTSELQSLMRISYAVFCLKKKKSKCELHI